MLFYYYDYVLSVTNQLYSRLGNDVLIVTCPSFHSPTFIASRMHWAVLLLVMYATKYMISACHWLICIPHKAAVAM